MRSYEYRIMQARGALPIILLEAHLSDKAAIRSAQKEALGRPFEVWRGSELIRRYGTLS